jgi:hypothetical protein
MKSRTTRKPAPTSTPGIERVAYILPQGNLRSKTRSSGRPTRTKCYDGSGFLLVGMYESLGKTFTTHEAAAKYASEHGFVVKATRALRNARVPVSAVLAAVALLSTGM